MLDNLIAFCNQVRETVSKVDVKIDDDLNLAIEKRDNDKSIQEG